MQEACYTSSHMKIVQVRDVPDEVYDALLRLSKTHSRSLAGELRVILAKAAHTALNGKKK